MPGGTPGRPCQWRRSPSPRFKERRHTDLTSRFYRAALATSSKEAAMPARKFQRIVPKLILSGCAVVFGACIFIEHAQAQLSVPTGPIPTPPTQSPTLNPSNPGTVPQPSYQPITPTAPSIVPSTPSAVPSREVTSPANEEPSIESTTARSGQMSGTTRSVHHHRGRSTLVTYSCGYLGCVRTYPWAFPCQYYSRYCYWASAGW